MGVFPWLIVATVAEVFTQDNGKVSMFRAAEVRNGRVGGGRSLGRTSLWRSGGDFPVKQGKYREIFRFRLSLAQMSHRNAPGSLALGTEFPKWGNREFYSRNRDLQENIREFDRAVEAAPRKRTYEVVGDIFYSVQNWCFTLSWHY